MGIIKQYSRISHHTLTSAPTPTGQPAPFTVPQSEDFTDGSWVPTDLALSEFGIVEDEKRLFVRIDDEIKEVLLDGSSIQIQIPGNSTEVLFNLNGDLAADPGLRYDPAGDRELYAVTNKAGIQLGNAVKYGNVNIPGAGLWYDGGEYFQANYIDPSYVAAAGEVSGFYAGDLSALGGVDFSWTAGYRDTDSNAAYNISGEPGKVDLVARDAAGDGIEVNATPNQFNIRLDNSNSQFKVTSDQPGTGIGIEIEQDGQVIISGAYKLPTTSQAGGYQVVSNGTSWGYTPQPRYTGYFNNTGATTTISTSDTWTKLSGTTTQTFTNNGLVHTDNRIENTGANGIFKITAIMSAETASANQILHMAVFKDDGSGFAIWPCSEQRVVTRAGGGSNIVEIYIQCLIELNAGDMAEIWVKNASSTDDIAMSNLNVIYTELK